MIKVNFNQKKTDNVNHDTTGLASKRTSQMITQISEMAKEAQELISPQAIIKILINVILILSLPIGLKFYEIREIGKLTTQKNQEQSVLDQKNQEVARLKKELESYAYIKDIANEFENKKNFLKEISEDRLVVPRIMDFIQNQIPKDLWLTDLQIDLKEEDRKISLSGFSVKESSINYFTNMLQQILQKESISVDTRDIKDGSSDSILKTSFNLKGELI